MSHPASLPPAGQKARSNGGTDAAAKTISPAMRGSTDAREADHPNGRSNTASRPIRHVSKPAIVQSPDRPTATKEPEARSPRTSATTPASRQVPLSASATTTGPTARALPERVVGATSIALATSLVIQNAVLVWVGAPSYGDPIKEVLSFHAENRGGRGRRH